MTWAGVVAGLFGIATALVCGLYAAFLSRMLVDSSFVEAVPFHYVMNI